MALFGKNWIEDNKDEDISLFSKWKEEEKQDLSIPFSKWKKEPKEETEDGTEPVIKHFKDE